MDATIIFMNEIEKTAKIFGSIPSAVTGSTHPGMPHHVREAAMERYVKEKAQEEPSSVPASLLGGGGIGAGVGGGLGALIGGLPGAAIGAGAGAGLGSLGGLLARHVDKGRIERAKKMLVDPSERSQGLGEMMEESERYKTKQLNPTNAVLLASLLARLDRRHED
jgi:hypothetical protein